MTTPPLLRVLRACAPALLAPLLALLLAACADDGTDDTGSAEEPAADESERDTDPAGEAEGDDDAAGEAAAGPDENPDDCVDDPDEDADYFPEQATFSHAEAAAASYHGTYKVLEIDVAFRDDPVRYVLVQCGLEPPSLDGDLADATVIEVPVAETVTMTTTNIPHFDELGSMDALVGVGNPAFVTTESALGAIEAGEIEGFGDAEGTPDLERVVAAEPDLLVMDAFGETVVETAERLEDAGVPVLFGADFEEATLLGRAEWLKVTAMLLNAEGAAEARFSEIQHAYEEVAAQVADAEPRPRVLSDMPFEGTWHAAGGRGVTAQAIEEAGGEYVFADDDSTSSVAYDLETVLDRAADADVWIAAGSVHGTLDDLLSIDERFAEIQAVADGQVWAGDAATTPEGGNARFESAYLRADVFLADLAAILHPDRVDHEPVYYGRVPEG